MTTSATGRLAESAAANYLEYGGFAILDRNWRTRQCEIDIVAAKDGLVYCVEVKYRHTALQGGGLEYITPKKQQQMRFAADIWVQRQNWRRDYRLGALEVSGPDYTITEFIDDIG